MRSRGYVSFQGDKSILNSFFFEGSGFWSNQKTDRGLDESTQRLRVCLTHDGRIRPVPRVWPRKKGDRRFKRYKPLLKHELNIHGIQLTLTGQCELTTAISLFFVPEG